MARNHKSFSRQTVLFPAAPSSLLLMLSLAMAPSAWSDTATQRTIATSTQPTTAVSSPPPSTQQNSETTNRNNNNQGADQSTSLGVAAIAAGMGMVGSGLGMMANPFTAPAGAQLVAAGMALIASGMSALDAAAQMRRNANTSNGFASNMGSLGSSTVSGPGGPGGPGAPSFSTSNQTGASGVGSSKLEGSSGGVGSISIDPALTRNVKLEPIFSKLEQNTGIDGGALIDGLQRGESPLSILADASKFSGNKDASLENLESELAKAKKDSPALSSGELLDQLGLEVGDLGADSGEYDLAAGTKRAPSATGTALTVDDFWSKKEGANPGAGGATVVPAHANLSPEVKAALEKRGLMGEKTLFQMVHEAHQRKIRVLFGSPLKGFPLPPLAR